MKIDTNESGQIRLEEVYNTIELRTEEGNRFFICMRDDGLELGIIDTSIKNEGPEVYINWHTVKSDGITLLANIKYNMCSNNTNTNNDTANQSIDEALTFMENNPITINNMDILDPTKYEPNNK